MIVQIDADPADEILQDLIEPDRIQIALRLMGSPSTDPWLEFDCYSSVLVSWWCPRRWLLTVNGDVYYTDNPMEIWE